MKTRYLYIILIPLVASLILASPVQASDGGTHNFGMIFLWIAIFLLAAKFSSLIERLGQPSVLGELVMGVILGNLTLVGFHFFEPAKSDPILIFLAELGVVILLFQVGLECNVSEMRRVGFNATLVAVVGVIVPLVLGTFLVGPLLLPGLDFSAYLFLGAALTATSVGITARIFRDLGQMQSSEAKIVMGAAVIDDVLGLIILAIVSGIVTAGSVSVGEVSWIIAKAMLFMVGTTVLGQLFAPRISRWFSRINTGIGMKFTLAIGACLVFAYLANAIGLAPIVGAFAAGLVLDPVHFRNFKDPEIVADLRESLKDADANFRIPILIIINRHADRHIDALIEPLGHFFVPLFFIMTGLAVRLETLFNLPILMVALGITVVAFVGKLVAGTVATGEVNKSIIGWSMVPRGEVGLIFAATGLSLGVISAETYSIIVIMVIITTLVAPLVLTFLLRRHTGPRSQKKAVQKGYGETVLSKTI